MKENNTKVATAENSMTPTQNKNQIVTSVKDNTPTGKVKLLKDKETVRKEREEQYKNFRINALKRRAKRIGLSEDQTKIKVEELIKQLNTPNSYMVLIMFNPNDQDLVKAALQKEDLAWKMMANSYLFIEADQETLATLREIMPPGTKIYLRVKKKPSVLADIVPIAKSKKKAKRPGPKTIKRMCKKNRKIKKTLKLMQKRALKASNKASGTTVQLNAKNASTGLKTASTTMIPRRKQHLKKAA